MISLSSTQILLLKPNALWLMVISCCQLVTSYLMRLRLIY
nr:MAG TPA: hypothetical protein [Caudoviricetes sp.]